MKEDCQQIKQTPKSSKWGGFFNFVSFCFLITENQLIDCEINIPWPHCIELFLSFTTIFSTFLNAGKSFHDYISPTKSFITILRSFSLHKGLFQFIRLNTILHHKSTRYYKHLKTIFLTKVCILLLKCININSISIEVSYHTLRIQKMLDWADIFRIHIFWATSLHLFIFLNLFRSKESQLFEHLRQIISLTNKLKPILFQYLLGFIKMPLGVML